MKQFILKEGPDKNGIIRLKGDDYHYLAKVRRLKQGDVFTALFPNTGNPVTVSVLSTDGLTLTGSVLTEATGKTSRNALLPPIILFQAMPKESKMDLIVRQAAEGGINEIVPFFAEHSIPKKLSRNQKPGKSREAWEECFAKTTPRVKRWERIVKEARQQSGSAIDTKVRDPFAIDELFDYWKKLSETEALGLVFCLLSDVALVPEVEKPLAQGGFHRYLNKEPSLIVLAIGPEGGFSADEIARFTKAGFKPVNMGGAILRTETASLYGAAAVKITLMEKAFWTLKEQQNEQAS